MNDSVRGIRPDLLFGATPHNAVSGQNVTGTIVDLRSEWGHVGILSSRNSATTITGGEIRDCEGPYIYSKGNTGGSATGVTCFVSDQYTQRSRGIFSVEDQGGTTNDAFTFDGCIAWISDPSKIHAVANIAVILGRGGRIYGKRDAKQNRPDTKTKSIGSFQIKNIGEPVIPEVGMVFSQPILLKLN